LYNYEVVYHLRL